MLTQLPVPEGERGGGVTVQLSAVCHGNGGCYMLLSVSASLAD